VGCCLQVVGEEAFSHEQSAFSQSDLTAKDTKSAKEVRAKKEPVVHLLGCLGSFVAKSHVRLLTLLTFASVAPFAVKSDWLNADR